MSSIRSILNKLLLSTDQDLKTRESHHIDQSFLEISQIIDEEKREASYNELDVLAKMQQFTKTTNISYLTKEGERYVKSRKLELENK